MARRIVIVGASLAGAMAAITLRQDGFDGDVMLVGDEAHPPYERPPLSKQYLRGEAPFEKALVRPPAFYTEQNIELITGVRAVRLDTSARVVHLDDGREMPYDKALIATGARNRRLSIPGAELDGIHYLRTVEEADRLRAELAPGRRAVLVGMGFIGSEVAASLRAKGIEVTAIDPSPAPLSRVVGDTIADAIAALHRDHGVETHFDDAVIEFRGSGRVESVVTRHGRTLPCDFVVVGIGVEPAMDLAANGTLEAGQGILVDEYCRTSAADVFAAGDVANHYHPIFGERMRVEHWQNAMQHGAAAARNMLERQEPYAPVHWFWSDQYDVNLQYAGVHRPWDRLVVRGRLEERNFLACYLRDDRLDAVVGFNRGKDVRRAMPIIKSRTTVDERALADEDVDLRTLVPPAGEATLR